jgi:Family of unknown function (DUF6499)
VAANLSTVVRQKNDPCSTYDLDDWQWEFLRRNRRYRRRYRAVQRAEERGWGHEYEGEMFFIADNWAIDLRKRLSLCSPPTIDDPDGNDDPVSLPNPDIPRHKFQYCPIGRYPAVVVEGPSLTTNDPKLDEIIRGSDGLFGLESEIPQEHKVTVDIDARCKLQTILAELKKTLPAHLAKGRDHLKKFESYLEVWDLRKEGLTDTQIAQRLWPDEYATNGGRDSGIGNKGYLIQRVYDYYDAIEKLIENSFSPRRRSPKITK